MRLPASILVKSPADLLCRSMWFMLGAVHIAPVYRLGSGMIAGELETAKWLSLLAITLSLAFFALKAAGVPFLRIQCRWTGIIIFLLACGLLHGNATAHDWFQKTGYTTLAVATAAGTHSVLRLSRKSRPESSGTEELGGRLWASARRLLAELVRLVQRSIAADLAFHRRLIGAVEALAEDGPLGRILVCQAPPRAPPV
jgi:hypothetical protein